MEFLLFPLFFPNSPCRISKISNGMRLLPFTLTSLSSRPLILVRVCFSCASCLPFSHDVTWKEREHVGPWQVRCYTCTIVRRRHGAALPRGFFTRLLATTPREVRFTSQARDMLNGQMCLSSVQPSLKGGEGCIYAIVRKSFHLEYYGGDLGVETEKWSIGSRKGTWKGRRERGKQS